MDREAEACREQAEAEELFQQYEKECLAEEAAYQDLRQSQVTNPHLEQT